MKKVKDTVGKMTLSQKAELCSGKNFWETVGFSDLGVPSISMSDGPHGVRKQVGKADHLGENASIPATVFPSASALASSFDRELVAKMAAALAEEALAQKVDILLGPGCNIKRSPLCGRNFEYFSEDPYLTAQLGIAYVKGLQKYGVGASLKHFALNNQETRRLSVNSIVDERTQRELYLAAFEEIVKQAQPWTVMCSYNRVNGIYCSENRRLLTELLREEWGFRGAVISDWGAVNHRVDGIKAGLDLEMPYVGTHSASHIVESVRNGDLDEKQLDATCSRLVELAWKTQKTRKGDVCLDWERQNEKAREFAAECMVLLKNEEKLLPLNREKKIAFLGEFFESPRYQGAGSSHGSPYRITSCRDVLPQARYAKGFHISDEKADPELIEQALKLAHSCDVCVIFVGLPETYESEGHDRTHLRLPDNQNNLIEQVSRVQSNLVVVLHNGSPVEMPWIHQVKAVLECNLGGQAAGAATADILYGRKNPSGRLAETFPFRLQDTPSYLFYNTPGDQARYAEGIYVGYRYYETKEIPVLFEFGYGLSYTEFEYQSLSLSSLRIAEEEELNIEVMVKNVGGMAGKEVVQLYLKSPGTEIDRPSVELKGFTKLELNPGEIKTALFTLNRKDFSYFDQELSQWRVESGFYTVCIGKSCRNFVFTQEVEVDSPPKPILCPNINTVMGDLITTPQGENLVAKLLSYVPEFTDCELPWDDETKEIFRNRFKNVPARRLLMITKGKLTMERLEMMIAEAFDE